MTLFYVVACIFLVAGLVLYFYSKKIAAVEMIVGGASAFAAAGLFHLIAYASTTSDTETWSGQVIEAVYRPRWVEEYTYLQSHYNSKGEFTHTTVETAQRTHPNWWYVEDTIPQTIDITREKYNELVEQFRKHGSSVQKVRGSRGGIVSGDRFDYHCGTPSDFMVPTTCLKSFENRIKAGPTAFSFEKIDPKDKGIPDYPPNQSKFRSNRLVESAFDDVSLLEWDRMNARLGPTKLVNVILCGFRAETSPEIAQKIKAKWIGGKKNDVVLCYGGRGTDGKATWSECFGWTKSEFCKANLKTILLDNPIDNSIIPKIEDEIRQNYELRDWSEFSYISIEPPTWTYVVFFIFILGMQVGLYICFFRNEEDKEELLAGYQRSVDEARRGRGFSPPSRAMFKMARSYRN